MTNRNHAFDLLCALCILRMMMLHVLQLCGHAQDGCWQKIMVWTYFFMAFFFFKSGYFNKGVVGETWPYILGKVKRLFIPYLCCGLIGNVLYFAFFPFLLKRYHTPIEPIEWEMVWTRSGFFGNPPVWFLFSFFCAYIGVYLLEKVRYLHWAVLFFPLISYILFRQGNPLWMGLNNLWMGIYFFYLGKVWHSVHKCIDVDVCLWIAVLMSVLFILVNEYFPGSYTMSSNTFVGNPWATILGSSLALCGLSGIAIGLHVPRISLLCFMGEHSMIYFVAHYPILYFYKFTHLCFGRSIYGRYEEVIILIPTLLIVCSWLIPYVERIPYLSGKWPQRKYN